MRMFAAFACTLALALAGCGSGTSTVSVSSAPPKTGTYASAITSFTVTSTPPPVTQTQPSQQATATATACGTLGARFRGIENLRGIRDPQPGAMHGRRVARELIVADGEALAADREVEAELRAHGGSPAVARALERAARRVKRLDRALRASVGDSVSTGFRLQARFLRFAFSELRAVCQTRGG